MSTPSPSRRLLEFIIQVEWSDEDNAYIAKCLTLSSIAAHGLTPEDALHEYAIALQGVLEDQVKLQF